MFRESSNDIAELKKRYRELGPKVAERRNKRQLQKSRMINSVAEMCSGIFVQAMGTVLGAALIYLASVAGGLLEGTNSIKFIAWIIILIAITGVFVSLIISLIFRREEFKLLQIQCRLAEHEIAQKMTAGTPLDIEELNLVQAGLIDVQSVAYKVKAEKDRQQGDNDG